MMTLTDPDTLRQLLLAHPGWVLAALALIAFAECFALLGIVVPGVVLLGVAAFAAGAVRLALVPCLLATFFGALAGDGLSYALGRRLHGNIRQSFPFRRNPHWIGDGERFFARHGTWSVAIGRFVGPIRPVIPLIAGVLSMPARRFLAVDLLAGLAWAPAYVLPGYFVGAAVEREYAPPEVLVPAAAAVLGLLMLLLLRRRRRAAHDDGGTLPPRE